MVRQHKILIVDKDQAFATELSKAFAGRHAVSCARDGREGWAKVKLQNPDLIIYDTPEENLGESLLFRRRVRNYRNSRNTPVLILADSKHHPAHPMVRSACGEPLPLPVDLIMEKPPIPSRLVEPVEAALRACAAFRTTAASRQAARPRPHDIILCVEPDRWKAAQYSRALAEEGCEIEAVPTLKEAIGRMRQVKFGCIVLDVDLPDMAGYDAVSVIKTIDPEINIVVTVAENSKALEARVRREEIFYYYIESFDIEELRLAVRSALAAARRRD